MKSILVLFFIFFVLGLCQDRPTNYFASETSVRGQQQQVNNFAVWNFTNNDWVYVLPPVVTGGSVNGLVAVGTGVLAYGSFTSIGGRPAAGLAYYDGIRWCAPEGVGLFSYTPNPLTTQYNGSVPAASSAFAATVSGNDVYLLGAFNQVGLVQGGVAGMVKLTWSAGGVFTIGKIGLLNYNEQIPAGTPCTQCPRRTQPLAGSRNKLVTYTSNNNQYFVFQNSRLGNLWTWQVDTDAWVQITNSNTARNITNQVQDFDVNNGVIYVVGKFSNLNDPTPANQYLHLAISSDNGASWRALSSPQPFPVANFGDLPIFVDPVTGINLPALTGSGFSSIYVVSANEIYVAGGWRITERNVTVDNLAGQLQTRVLRVTGSTFTLISERWAGASFGASPNFNGPTIKRLAYRNGILFAFGDFLSYGQIIPFPNSRYGQRMREVYKGAACWDGTNWAPYFGGYITTGSSNDATPDADNIFIAMGTNFMYFHAGTANIQSTYGVLSGGIFAYGGDGKNKKNRWNPVMRNLRWSSTAPFVEGVSSEGKILATHITKKGDALIVGGQFDYVGQFSISGIAAYNPVADSIQNIGGGIYSFTADSNYYRDSIYNNRIGCLVHDIEEWDDMLIIAGLFNRNNTGQCLSNIATNKFRKNGAGWLDLAGGCDNSIRDILVVGNILYATGDFQYCGVNPQNVTSGPFRGVVPTSRIAFIDLGKKENAAWRPLGTGLQGTRGSALAWRNGQLFVGGTFTSAGGRLYTNGIARWVNDHWEDVVAKCRGNCDRPNNVFPYIGTDPSPAPNSRIVGGCTRLREIDGVLYCIDGTKLAFYNGGTWHRASELAVSTGSVQNSVIVRNATQGNYIIVSGTSTVGANTANYMTYQTGWQNFIPSHGGFSLPASTLSASSIITYPAVLLFSIVLFYIALF